MAVDIESIVTAILILLSPLVLAIPLSLGWKWWVGTEPEHVHYREKVRRVLDAGLPLRRFRPCRHMRPILERGSARRVGWGRFSSRCLLGPRCTSNGAGRVHSCDPLAACALVPLFIGTRDQGV